MTIETSKTIGGIGAILMFVGVLPLVAYMGIIALVGLIMVLVAAKGFADIYKEKGIFNNAMYAVIITIIGVIIAVGVAFVVLVNFFSQIGINIANFQDWSALSNINPQALGMDMIGQFLGGMAIVVVAVWVFAIITAFFVRRALGLLSAKSGVGLFATTGLLILIGAVIPLIGLLLIWISMLLLAAAFFSVRSVEAQSTQPTPPPSM